MKRKRELGWTSGSHSEEWFGLSIVSRSFYRRVMLLQNVSREERQRKGREGEWVREKGRMNGSVFLCPVSSVSESHCNSSSTGAREGVFTFMQVRASSSCCSLDWASFFFVYWLYLKEWDRWMMRFSLSLCIKNICLFLPFYFPVSRSAFLFLRPPSSSSGLVHNLTSIGRNKLLKPRVAPVHCEKWSLSPSSLSFCGPRAITIDRHSAQCN